MPGMTQVRNINNGNGDAGLGYGFVEAGDSVYFSAYDFDHGQELWKSNETTGVTTLVKDIAPGRSDSYPSFLSELGGKLFFTVNDYSAAGAGDLWVSDGTAAGTVVLKDISPVPTMAFRNSAISMVVCTSQPTTASAARSFGPVMAPRQGPSWSRTFGQVQMAPIRRAYLLSAIRCTSC